MSRISFNERRLLNRVRKLENRIGILSELCELRAGQEAEKISERYRSGNAACCGNWPAPNTRE